MLPEWQLAVTFNDGSSGIVDVSALVQGPEPVSSKRYATPLSLRQLISIAAWSPDPWQVENNRTMLVSEARRFLKISRSS